MRLPRTAASLALVVLCAAALACAPVRPWERENLARPEMAWDPDPLESALRGHVHFSKEAAAPAGHAGGGGCGCN